MTKIEWTEATWNPIVGCSVVSPGCTNCYAMAWADRLGKMANTVQTYGGLTEDSRAGPVWTGEVRLASHKVLSAPLRRRKPTMYFVNSMGDLFHEDVPDEWIDRVFAVMALCPQHTFQVLTKRADRMRNWVTRLPIRQIGEAAWPINALENAAEEVFESCDWDGAPAATRAYEAVCDWPLPNVWLGVSAEDQTRADQRIPDLLATPAAIRFVSAEPLLGPVDMTSMARRGGTGLMRPLDGRFNTLDWVIAGGESGPGARPMHPDWARSLRDQCDAAGVPFFFKQWGDWAPWDDENWFIPDGTDDVAAHERSRTIDGVEFLRVGKRAAGRLLDGREWNGMPRVMHEEFEEEFEND